MISIAAAALGFQSLSASKIGSTRVSEPMMISRREVFTTVSSAALAVPLAASATYDNGQNKAKGILLACFTTLLAWSTWPAQTHSILLECRQGSLDQI